MAKVLKGIRMSPEVHERLNAMASEYRLPVGEVVEGLTNMREMAQAFGPAFQASFAKLERLAMRNTGVRAEWGED
jgi:hypothetical protein